MDSIATTTSVTSTRDRLIHSMLDALGRKGFHGVGLTELLSMAGAPKGVMYHHFPGGKAELAVAAIEAVVQQITNGLSTLLNKSSDPAQALGHWMASAQKLLSGSGFEHGCPLAAIALESSPDDIAIREALARGFQRIRVSLEIALNAAGISGVSAHNLAALMVSAYEGALVQARVAGSVEVMQATTDALVQMVQSHLSTSHQKGR
jgi:TetR/AcrR family transcriptional repressor of lmrAB and yxaGH operons